MPMTFHNFCGGGLLATAAIFGTPAKAATFDLNLLHLAPASASAVVGDIFSIDNIDFGKDDGSFVESRLHWVMDVVYHDDLLRLRTENGSQTWQSSGILP